MACFSPLRAYVGEEKENGKINLVWKRSNSWKGEELNLPCGKCVGCRLERARQWAVRCMHEASMHENNCFITLTYNDENLPKDGSLVLDHWQLFFKRLRKRYGNGIRYYHCGEYGERLLRPHYHALLFNHDFEDKKLLSINGDSRLYYSDSLANLWNKGYATVGNVTFKSASYVARYVMKKISKDEEAWYGEKKQEYQTMSRRPGIGRGWYDKFKGDVYPSDEMVVNGVVTKPPRFYDKLLESEDKMLYEKLKIRRVERGKRMVPLVVDGKTILVNDNDSFRLPIKEICVTERVKLLKRPLEVM